MERTFVLAKPEAYSRGLLAEVTRRHEGPGVLALAGIKMVVPSKKLARAHCALLADAGAGGTAGDDGVEAAASQLAMGPVVAMCWEGPRAVAAALAIAGAADPQVAAPGTIRGDLAHAQERNVVDCAPDAETAARLLKLWFSPSDLVDPSPPVAVSDSPPSQSAATTTTVASDAVDTYAGSLPVGSPPPAACKLPKEGERNVLVTSALPYVNNVPHLGNIIGCVLSADVYARYLRQRGVNAIYICGTDEYGTATEIKALAEGLTPQQICDKYYAIHKQVYEWFDCRFDHFGRTSTPYQKQIAQSIFLDVHRRGFLLQQTTKQLYSVALGKFLADRYVQGTCPNCGYDDARGDQCDACGKLLNPTELINPKCTASGTVPEVRETDHLYLDLPRLTPALEKWIATSSSAGVWTNNSVSTTESWLKTGLQPRCITRDLKWGVPVPLPGWEHKVFYVWFDAPIGYVSITAGYCGEGWTQWWMPDPALNVELTQFMGKDNTPFHTVIFPATLIATGNPWLKLHNISTTEYLNYEDGKFSKSRGTGVFGDQAQDTGIPAHVFRYYLLSNRPETADSAFKWDDLAAKNNTELLANLGNFVNRAVTFIKTKFGGKVPKADLEEDAAASTLTARVNEQLCEYVKCLERVAVKEGLRHAMAISRLGNLYLQEAEPWKKIKTDPAAAGEACGVAANLCRLLAVIFEPYMGSAFSAKIFRMLGLDHSDEANRIPDTLEVTLPEGHPIGEPELLFTTITPEQVETLRKRFAGTQEQADAGVGVDAAKDLPFPADVRVGRIDAVDAHPESADRLWVLQVELGGERRQIVSGIREFYPEPAGLVGRKVAILCNLKPASLRGVESQGMMLAAAKKDAFGLLLAPADAPPGARVHAGDLRNPTDEIPILELKEFQKLPLTVGAELQGFFKKTHGLHWEGKPVVAENVPEGAKIK